jgi:DNA repair protein RAD50
LDDAKTKAESASKKRDEANGNPKRKDIPIEITRLTNKMEDVRVKLENDKSVQTELLQLQEHQIQIQQIKKSADSDLEALQEDIRLEVNADTWRSYKLKLPPTNLPKREQDKVGDQLKVVMDEVSRETIERFQEKETELSTTNDDVRRLTQLVSEKRALMQQDALSASNKTARMATLQESVDQLKQILHEVRTFENKKLPDLNETMPQELLDYLTKLLESIELESTEGVQSEVITKLVKSLFRLVSWGVGQPTPIDFIHKYQHHLAA